MLAPLELKDASAQYNGTAVLRGVSIKIEPGEKVSLIGKSGAGKTTLLKLLYAQRPSESALVPQDLGLVGSLSVFHNIYMGRLDSNSTWHNLLNLVRPMRAAIDGVRQVAANVGLGELLFERVGEISGGQQQRTAIGRALYRASPIFFGDEPVSSVDERQSRDVLDAIVGEHGTVVLSMHDVDLALAYSDRLIGLESGRVVLDAPVGGVSRSDIDRLYRG
ncbi:MAG: ATP-binding cassette domain-containing protein [Gammaproteobacteria bacterium]